MQTPALSEGSPVRQLPWCCPRLIPHYYGPIPSSIYLLALCLYHLAFLLPSPSPSNLVSHCGLVQPLTWTLLGQVQLPHGYICIGDPQKSPKLLSLTFFSYLSLSVPEDSACRCWCGVSSPSPVTKSFYHSVMSLAANTRRTSKR